MDAKTTADLISALRAMLKDCQPGALQAEGIARAPKLATIAAARAALAQAEAVEN